MSGTHRGKPDNSVLIALLAFVVAPIAMIGFIIYLGVTHPSGIWIIVSVLVLYLTGSLAYWFGGKRRLVAILRTRATGDGPRS